MNDRGQDFDCCSMSFLVLRHAYRLLVHSVVFVHCLYENLHEIELEYHAIVLTSRMMKSKMKFCRRLRSKQSFVDIEPIM